MSTPPAVSALKCPQCGANLPLSETGYTICQYCGSSLVINRTATENVPAETVMRGLRLRQLTITDTQGTGLELFRMLAPVGWQWQGGCRWLLDNPGMPATVSFQLWNPQGMEAFEILPNINLTWNSNPMARMMYPVGSRYLGAEVRPPMGIQQALQELIVPRYRGSAQNLQIMRFDAQPDLPRLAKSEAPLSGGVADGGKLRIRYVWRNVEFEEDIYGVVETWRVPIATMFSSEVIIWFVDFLFSFRAGAGRLDATADLFGLLISSFRLNPHWYAAFKSIAQTLAQRQIQHIQHIGQISQILAQTSSQMREQNLNDWYARQATYDRLSTDRSRAIRDVEGFYDPHRGEVVELPAGYGYAWANNLGEYIVTEQADFNPNIGSNLHWEPMPQQ